MGSLRMTAFEREREHSISQSYEGSDIVFENLLGDLSKRTNGNSTPSGTTHKIIDISSDIEDIFDDDIFDLNKDEMDKHTVYLLTDAEEEEESIEGADPTMTPRPTIDVFDSILLDLDEKTKEMEKNEVEESKKKNKRKIKKAKTKKRRKHKRKKKKQPNKKIEAATKESIERFHQTEEDRKMLDVAICDQSKLNPWVLRNWEFNEQHRRRSLRALLCSLDES